MNYLPHSLQFNGTSRNIVKISNEWKYVVKYQRPLLPTTPKSCKHSWSVILQLIFFSLPIKQKLFREKRKQNSGTLSRCSLLFLPLPVLALLLLGFNSRLISRFHILIFWNFRTNVSWAAALLSLYRTQFSFLFFFMGLDENWKLFLNLIYNF